MLCFYTCLSFILFGGYTRGTRYTPRDQVHPPGPSAPPDQVHPPGIRCTHGPGPPRPGTPPGTKYTPQDQVHHPPGTRYTPQDQVHPPDQVHHPLGPGTPSPPEPGTPPRPGTPSPPEQSMLGDTVNVRAVRILLECNLVYDTSDL